MAELIQSVVAQYPIIAMIYGILSGGFVIFCAVAAFTKTKKDDVWADKLKRFFSLT